MTDRLVNGVDDRLPVIPDLIDVAVEVENPAQGLLRWRDVVALGAEHHDRRPNIAEIYGLTIRQFDPSSGEIVADEKLVDNELDLFGVQVDVTAPPSLEFKIAIGLGVDFGIDVVLLGPQRIRRIHVFEILYQPGAVELAGAEIAGERS